MPSALHPWPDERIRRLFDLWPDPTKTIIGIARELGVSAESVKRRANYLALHRRPDLQSVRVANDSNV